MKIFGCLLILASSLLSSYTYDTNYKKRLATIKEIKAFIEQIRVEIEYFSRGITDIFKDYKGKSQSILSLISTGVCPKIKNSEAEDSVNELFQSLGKGYKKEQIKLCEYTCKRLEDAYFEQEIQYKGKVKVFATMSVFSAVGILTLLI